MRIYLVSCTTLALLASAAAQNTAPPTTKLRSHPATQVHPEARPDELPITRVALYKNGVGFFEHSGRVTGDQSVTIDFTSTQLNDVLQSLTAIDLGGGRISGAGYNSTAPLEQQLKALPLALSDDPSDYDFYNAIRGARVQASGSGISIVGRLLSIDLRPSPPKGTDADSTDKPNRRFLTVVSDSGQVHTFELTSAVTVTLLDSTLHTDVTRYLELLASTRNQGLRHLTLLDRGTGIRDLRVSYISEVPVWKSTYRILFTDAKAANATLQGWSVVDNTTGSDWTNVHLDLIAGAPQSFIQPISTPYYTRRPEIPLPSEAQLEPQTHESGETELPLALSAPTKIFLNEPSASKPMAPKLGTGVGGMMGGSAGGVMGGIPGGMPSAQSSTMKVEQLSDYAEAASASLVPQTKTASFDNYFEYTLTDPITIRKNESALVPILQTKLPMERVTLWSPLQPQALRALWITNSSTLTLDRGSFSIVENGSFGGQGLFDPIHPGERRLLTYAVDQAVTVDNGRNTAAKHHLRSITVAKGILTERYRDVNLRDYAVRNASAEPRTILMEHPISPGFQLQNPGGAGPEDTSLKPEESTASLYRFRLNVPAHETAHLRIAETRSYPRTIQIGGINENQIRILLQDLGTDSTSNTALMQQFQPVLDAQRHLAELNQRRQAIDAQLNRLRGEEERQRANIVALKDTDKTAQKRFVDELGRIEDQILDRQKQLEALDKEIQSAQQDLSNKVQTVQFDQTLEP